MMSCTYVGFRQFSPNTAGQEAAMIAGKKAGWFDSLNDVSESWLSEEKFFPLVDEL